MAPVPITLEKFDPEYNFQHVYNHFQAETLKPRKGCVVSVSRDETPSSEDDSG